MNLELQYEQYVQIYKINAHWLEDEIIIFINTNYNEDRKVARPKARTDNDFENVRIFYNRMLQHYPKLLENQTIPLCLNGDMVGIGSLLNRLFNTIIVRKIVKKYEPHEQDEAIEKLMIKTRELFPACWNIMKPIYEFNFKVSNLINLVPMSEVLGVYKELYHWLIEYDV